MFIISRRNKTMVIILLINDINLVNIVIFVHNAHILVLRLRIVDSGLLGARRRA